VIAELVASGGFVPGSEGVIVAGAGCGDPEAVLALAGALSWPVLADPRSGLRSDGTGVVAAADGILRSTAFAASHRPHVVLHLGRRWASKVVTTFLADLPSVVVDPHGWTDPERDADRVVRCDTTAFCRTMTAAVGTPGSGRSGEVAPWPREWGEAQSRADRVLSNQLLDLGAGVEPVLTEPALAHRLFQARRPGGTLVVSSSMPVRDVEAFGSSRHDPPWVLCNRGANGIDGVVSTALGVAMATGPTVAFVGDLAFLHDVSALVGPAGERPPLTVVVADNGGGGIFSFLPQGTQLPPERFERLFGTPQSADPAAVARGFGWDVVEIDGEGWTEALETALAPSDGGRVIVVRLPDRAVNVVAHDEINAAIVDAVDDPREVAR
jgi:2-succinyl-5-enolpyruvyl-6-hydroxy-3-cyclohexene-1-carboxylate synthase